MDIEFCGAAGEVTGSCHILRVQGHRRFHREQSNSLGCDQYCGERHAQFEFKAFLESRCKAKVRLPEPGD